MGPSERRVEIMRILCRKRCETIPNFAYVFNVSKRTILRDIEILSLSHPIYTERGKYGGVYIIDKYTIDRIYMNDEQIEILKKLYTATQNNILLLTNAEQSILKNIISQYSKPNNQKGESKNEQKRKNIIQSPL